MRFNTNCLRIALVCCATGSVAVAQDCCPASFPAPFDRYTGVELIRHFYPNVDPRTHLLGRGMVDEAGQVRGGVLYAANLWKGEDESKLLAMVETYTPEDGQRPTYGAAAYGLDLGLFAIVDGKLTLLAKLSNAADHSGHSAVDFDLAPYRVKPDLMALGLRSNYMHMGLTASTLTLFICSGTTFRRIFQRTMAESTEDVTGDTLEDQLSPEQMRQIYRDTDRLGFRKKAVLQVVPGKGEYNQFKIVEQQAERQKNGTLRKGTVVEMWSWAPAAQAYMKQ